MRKERESAFDNDETPPGALGGCLACWAGLCVQLRIDCAVMTTAQMLLVRAVSVAPAQTR
jgi:hypothetical protein